MEKKKMKLWKKILIVVGVIFAIFVIHTVRNMIILRGLETEVAKYVDSKNLYEKIINNTIQTTTVTEYYCKDDKAILNLTTTIKETGEVRKLTNYFDGEKTNTYIDTNGEKIALLNSNGIPSKIMIISMNFDDNLWYLLQVSATSFIKSEKYNGKQCYSINGSFLDETYIEKETGLMVRSIQGTSQDENGNKSDIVVEYYYEFNNVNDSVFVEPDLTEYKIQQ